MWIRSQIVNDVFNERNKKMIIDDIENLINNGVTHSYDTYTSPVDIHRALEDSDWIDIRGNRDKAYMEVRLTFRNDKLNRSITFHCDGHSGETLLYSLERHPLKKKEEI